VEETAEVATVGGRQTTRPDPRHDKRRARRAPRAPHGLSLHATRTTAKGGLPRLWDWRCGATGGGVRGR